MQFGWRTRRAGPRSLDFTNGDLRINEQLCIKMDGAHYRAALEAEDPDYSITLEMASMLNRGLIGDALLYASTSRWSGPRLKKFNFDPSEPRDVNGRWAKGGSSATDKAYLTPIGYNGYFHDAVVDDIMDFFRKDGSLAEKNIRFTNIVGMTVIPDFVSLPKGFKKGYLVEVKTGGDPPFTPNQIQVYPQLCIGGHALSNDPRLAAFGLPVGTLLPPLDILVVFTRGPGQPVEPIDYCEWRGVKP